MNKVSAILLVIISFIITGANCLYSQSLKQINPDTVTQGQYIKIEINGSNTGFTNITASKDVYFQKSYTYYIYADTLEVKNDSLMYGYFQIPYTFLGEFELVTLSPTILKLSSALFIQTQAIIPEITSVDPDSAYQGDPVTFSIKGTNTHFENCSYFRVRLGYLNADGYTIFNDSLVEVYKAFPYTFSPGTYNVKIENSIDGVIIKSSAFKILKSPTATELLSMSPDSVEQGQSVKVLIRAKNTSFNSSAIQFINIRQSSYGLATDSFKVINDTALYAWFTTVYSCPTGLYDLWVKHTTDELLTLSGCFKIYPTLNPPKLVYLSPDSAMQGDKLTVLIKGSNTHFNFLNLEPGVGLRDKNGNYIVSTMKNVVNDSFIYASLSIPLSAFPGFHDLIVFDSMDGEIVYKNAFKVIEKPNKAAVLLALPDTMEQGEKYTSRIFCKNMKFESNPPLFPYVRYKINASPHFNPYSKNIYNDSVLFCPIATNNYSESPTGVYDLQVVANNTSYANLHSAVTVIPGPGYAHLIRTSQDKFVRGHTYSIDIIGKNTRFTKASSQIVRLLYGYSDILPATSYNVQNDTLINANFNFSQSLPLGFAHIEVRDSGNTIHTIPIEMIQPLHYPRIEKVSPSFCKIGEKQTVIVHTKNTSLSKNVQYQRAVLIRNVEKDTLYGSNYQVINDTCVSFEIQSPISMLPGHFDVLLWGSGNGSIRSYKGVRFSRFSAGARILSISPDSGFLDSNVQLTIVCSATSFSKDIILFPVFFGPSGHELYADSIDILNDSMIQISLKIPDTVEAGKWDIGFFTDQEGDFYLRDKFLITKGVSVKELDYTTLNVYPNPFSDKIEIRSDIPIQHIEFCDLTARPVKCIYERNTNYLINTQDLISGVYLLKIVRNNEVSFKIVIKEY
jgi:hypothetical protein